MNKTLHTFFLRIYRWSSLVCASLVISTLALGQCGTTVYDPGGTGNYANNTTWTQTYCPVVAGEVVQLNFSVFITELNYDVLTIFNGPSTSAPVIGAFSGTGNPGTITSSATDGCLTLRFTSDVSINYAGWVAQLLCVVPPPPPAGDCIYVLSLFDSQGNGWGNASVTVEINGGNAQTYTVVGSSNQIVFGVNINDVIVLRYNASGPNGQNSYSLSMQGQGSPLFNSGSPPASGISYAALVDCIPAATPPQDCSGGITLCDGQAFNNNSNNTGEVVDLTSTNQGCLSAGERQGTWYYFSPSSAGTIGFTITPSTPTDYDFAVWQMSGSTITCPPPGPPLRCSFAWPTGPTGCGNYAVDLSEGAGGDRWVSTFNVEVGDVYILYVDNFSTNGQSFTLDWNLTNGASLDCTILPVELVELAATPLDRSVLLSWATVSETNASHYVIERSSDGTNYGPIGTMNAAGNSFARLDYAFTDMEPKVGVNYYRLIQIDADGTEKRTNTVHALFSLNGSHPIVVPNPMSDRAMVYLSRSANAHSLLVMDAGGRSVKEISLNSQTETDQVEFSMAGLDAGAYILSVLDKQGISTGHVRFIKQ